MLIFFSFSHLYIIVVINDSVIENIIEISTKSLVEESNKTTPLFFVAAVVNAIQYVPGYRMSYILGAGDSTTDPDGRVFYNRKVHADNFYFYRVFSIDSTQEVCLVYLFKVFILYV